MSSLVLRGDIKKDGIDIYGRKIKFVEPIQYDGEIYKVDGDYFIHLNIAYKYKENCGRCLESFIKEGRIILSGKLEEKNDKNMEEGEGEVIYYSEDELDLQEEILTTIVLALPMKPLCKEACKGICPQCGTNLNIEECNCVIEDIDPRLAVLKDLRLKE
ncbi:MAG: DUF177 domain-containing protein [Tissierellia bacterium]|nr:DUF177 domain-containing protein [Tissierellia bacterium]